MSQLIANINGKKVYSDKAVVSIVNTRVTFHDGSWCDVATGQVVNNGLGFINIGSPVEGSSEKITEGPTVYSAHNLTVQNVGADLEIQVHEADVIEVTIVGPSGEVKGISVHHKDDTVTIEGEGGSLGGVRGVTIGYGGGGTIISGGGSPVSIQGGSIRARRFVAGDLVGGNIVSIGGNVVSIGGVAENPTMITVKVPKGASVNLSGISGQSFIGDTDGNLQVTATDGHVHAGRVASATLAIQGGSDITVLEVRGSLNISIMGSGDVRVAEGQVSTLAVSIMGSGDATFRGKAENATLTIMGSGDIHAGHVVNRPGQSIMGSGDIHIGNW